MHMFHLCRFSFLSGREGGRKVFFLEKRKKCVQKFRLKALPLLININMGSQYSNLLLFLFYCFFSLCYLRGLYRYISVNMLCIRILHVFLSPGYIAMMIHYKFLFFHFFSSILSASGRHICTSNYLSHEVSYTKYCNQSPFNFTLRLSINIGKRNSIEIYIYGYCLLY